MKVMIVLRVIPFIVCFNFYVEAFNILTMIPFAGLSHNKCFTPFYEALAQKGHNMTIVSHYYYKFNSPNVRLIWLQNNTDMHGESLKEIGKKSTFYKSVLRLQRRFYPNCDNVLQNGVFLEFLQKEQHFDIIIMELFLHNCFLGIVNRFQAPLIGLSSTALFPWQPAWFGTPQNPAVNQVIFMGYKTPMSFFARVENTLLQVVDNLWYKYGMEKPGIELSRKYIGYEPPSPYNASIMLVNTHHSLHGARPLSPSIIEVGGLHVSNKKPKKLSKEMEDWINNAEAGVIYFSLGSMIKSDTFPEEQRKAFVRTFAKLPQRVLWKWENDSMQDKPQNVMIDKWMPQFDILCHSNVKVFISHGGMLGTTEAVHCGVPIIVMPQFGDQRHNSYAIENSGIGVILYLHEATERSIMEALQKVLHPQTYQNAKSLSERFRDRPLSALDTAVYWVEHVARHKGAAHMRPSSTEMPLYQYLLLDVIAFISLVLLAILFILYKLTIILLSLFVSSKKLSKEKLS